MEIETHPWKWYTPTNCKTLVIGTFPTAKQNRSFDFFYPNPLNAFWHIITDLSNIKFQNITGDAVELRKQALEKLRIGITDMGLKIERNDNSSLDEKIRVLEFMDIENILNLNPGIETIILTSSSGKNSASSLFKKYLDKKAISFSYKKGKKPIHSELYIKERKIKVAILYSTSPRAYRRIGLANLIAMYKEVIL